MNYEVLYVVILAYLLVTLYLGYRGWKSTKDSEGYLVAGRKTHPYIMAMSYGATFIRPVMVDILQYLRGHIHRLHRLWQARPQDGT